MGRAAHDDGTDNFRIEPRETSFCFIIIVWHESAPAMHPAAAAAASAAGLSHAPQLAAM